MTFSLRTLCFSLVMLLYFAFPFWMINQNEDVLEVGESFRFMPRAYDPYDAFRGRYVTLDYDGLKIKYDHAREIFTNDQEVYVKILRDQNNYAYFAEVADYPFDTPNYIITKTNYIGKDYVEISKPNNMSRYYMNEKVAPMAEKVYRDMAGQRGQKRDSTQVYLDVKIHEGKVVIEELYMNGVKASDYVRQQMEALDNE